MARWFKSPFSASFYRFAWGSSVDAANSPWGSSDEVSGPAGFKWTLFDLIDWLMAHPVEDERAGTCSVPVEVEPPPQNEVVFELSLRITVPKKPKRNTSANRSWTQMARPSEVRKAELVRIAEHRGMGKNTCRYWMLRHFADAVRNIEYLRTGSTADARKAAMAETYAFNRTFDEPLDPHAVKGALRSD